MAGHIGILGCSAEGASLCYRTICRESARLMGPHCHPQITMHTNPLSEYMRFIRCGEWQGVAELMLSSAIILERAGADFIICPDNTIHRVFDVVRARTSIPWLHIAEVVAEEAERLGIVRPALLGTSFLMEGPVYDDALGKKGMEQMVPEEEEREEVDRVIFDELVYGVSKEESKRFFIALIERMKQRGCDGVILGCTEIPLLVTKEDSPLPILDSTRLLALAAIGKAMELP